MGNDGGSIPKRRELVKDAARAPTISQMKATALESLAHAWSHCALSGSPLTLDSVVSDWRGRLYNYESVLAGLTADDVTAQPTPNSLGIKSLRDVAKLKFHKTGDTWACPISMKEMGPNTKSSYLVPCGHVFAEVAMKEIQEKSCPECSEDFKDENIITILPTTENEVERLQRRMDSLRAAGQTHMLKKDKSEKKKKRKAADDQADGKKAPETGDTSGARNQHNSKTNGINNSSAASVTAKVMAEQEERNKRRKLAAETAPKSVSVGRATPQSLQMGKT